MITLKILGSGSSGNCYLLESETECLVFECGLAFDKVKIALDFNVRKISGVLTTHCHSDHYKYAKDYEKAGFPVCAPWIKGKESITLRNDSKFSVQTFALTDKQGHFVHNGSDGMECPIYGYYIKHPDMGTLVYATDCEFIKYRFKSANHFLIEANHDLDMISDDAPNFSHAIRGHLSIQTACEFLKESNNDGLQNVVLCHLSQSNGNPQSFKERAEGVVSCPVYIAKPNLTIELINNIKN